MQYEFEPCSVSLPDCESSGDSTWNRLVLVEVLCLLLSLGFLAGLLLGVAVAIIGGANVA